MVARVTEGLAEFLAGIQFEDLPAEVTEHTKRCIVDFLGVCLGGSTMKRSRLIANFVNELGGAQEATVIGYPFKVPSPSAGLANGAVGHAMQMDDTDWASIAHLGTVAIPAALAVAEKRGASGRDLLLAIVLGYEGAIRVGAAMHPSHNRRGFSPNGTIGVFAGAIAAGKILALDAMRMADAIGSAAMQSSGLEEFGFDGSMSSILNTGHAAQAGIISALLAERGFTGSRGILEGRSGFCRAYADECDLSSIVAGLGERYRILDVWFKRYPTCAYANTSLDAILDLVAAHGIDPADISEVLIKTHSVVEKTLNNPCPANVTAAMLSLPYNAAVAILERQVTPREFTEEKLADQRVRAMMAKVKIQAADDELAFAAGPGRGSIVEIRRHDGTTRAARVKEPRGDTANPFSREEFLGKFRALTSPVLDPSQSNDILGVVDNLASIEDIRRLTSLLSLPAGSG